MQQPIEYRGWKISVYRKGLRGGYEASGFPLPGGEHAVNAFRVGPGAKKAATHAVKAKIDSKYPQEVPTVPEMPPITISGRAFPTWMSSHFLFHGETRQVVHLFGEMDLPLVADMELAWKVADNAAECCGYIASRKGNSIECYGREGEVYRVTYQDGRMAEIIDLAEPEEDEGPIDAAADAGLWDEEPFGDF